MHPQTLRMYDAKGLVSPRRTPGGTRRYSDSDLQRLQRIGQLTSELGLNLVGASRVLALEETVAELHRRLVAMQAQLDREARRAFAEAEGLKDEYVAVEHLLLALAESGGLDRQAILKALVDVRGGQRANSPDAEGNYAALEKFGRDLTELAERGKLDPVIGRDEEVRRVI